MKRRFISTIKAQLLRDAFYLLLLAVCVTPVALAQRTQQAGPGDVDRIMSYLTDDCVYSASVGPEPGQTFVGKQEVRCGVEAMLAYDNGAESRSGRCIVHGSIGVAEWSYVLPPRLPHEWPVEVRGCHIFEFRGNLIARKDTFRKTFPVTNMASKQYNMNIH